MILSKIHNLDKQILRNSSSDIHRKTSILLVLCMAFIAVTFMFVCMCDFIWDCRKNIVILMTYYTSQVIRIIMDIQFVTFNLLLKYQFVVLNKQLLSLFGVRSEREFEQTILDNICQASTDYSRNVPDSNNTQWQTRLGSLLHWLWLAQKTGVEGFNSNWERTLSNLRLRTRKWTSRQIV